MLFKPSYRFYVKKHVMVLYKQYKTIMILLLSVLTAGTAAGRSLDEIRQALEQSSVSQVQEKVYVHTDNTCYFVGDTLWYKAYVVRADDLRPTDMSRLLYVELLSPDGLLVERQTVVVSDQGGYSCGQFALRDSLYSGYYELRAYTRWMLNWGVRHHRYSTHDTWHFYNKQMAADYFRIWDGLFSRVLPIYSKPEAPGDYDARRMYQRPKTRLPRKKKDDLNVSFYPEGGHLVKGVPCRVAFEVSDQHGEAVDISGTLETEGQALTIKTEHMGRGTFVVTPGDKRLKARFTFRGKDYSISLPKAEEQGVTLLLGDDGVLTLRGRQVPHDRQYGVSLLCGGVLKHFAEVPLTDGHDTRLTLPLDSLPAGVADVTLFDSEGRIWADRLLFKKGGEPVAPIASVTLATAGDSITFAPNGTGAPQRSNRTYAPYEPISLALQLPEPGTVFSLAVRDTGTDEPTYDNGNIMTTLLLQSEVRGFIANPAHYFESDDAAHRRHLDLLMMVQGWRKYRWDEMADTTYQLRYQPEKTLTLEGGVYKMLNLTPVEPDEISSWQDGVGMINRKSGISEEYEDPWAEEEEQELLSTDDLDVSFDTGETAVTSGETIEFGDITSANDNIGVNHGSLRHEVLIEAEVSRGNQTVGSVQRTKDRGHFVFEIPPFFGDAYLNMKAYNEDDSTKKNMASRKDSKILNETAFPDYYVKRDLFFPMFTHDYSFYEKHQPDIDEELLIDTLSDLSMENDVYQLQNVNVKGHRRGRRAIDWKKPAFVLDAYELYNEMTDRGLSFGMVDMRQFPVQVCRYLYGNMNRYNSFHVDGRIDGATYYRNYDPDLCGGEQGRFRANRTSQSLYAKLKLSRLQDIRVFSDYEPRTEDSLMKEELCSADATVEMVTIPDDGRQPAFRDRHLIIHGINISEDFYQPDYSLMQPATPSDGSATPPADYRRTLYWNPNAVADDKGRFTTTFYNNGKETRIRMSAAGVTASGQLLYY